MWHTHVTHNTRRHTRTACVSGASKYHLTYIHIYVCTSLCEIQITPWLTWFCHTRFHSFSFIHTDGACLSTDDNCCDCAGHNDFFFFGLHTQYIFPSLVEVARFLRQHLYTNTRTHNTHTRTRNHTHTPHPRTNYTHAHTHTRAKQTVSDIARDTATDTDALNYVNICVWEYVCIYNICIWEYVCIYT